MDSARRRQDLVQGGVLIVAAHPDDETLGCGGTVADIDGVYAMAFTDGVSSRTYGAGDVKEDSVVVSERNGAFVKATKRLGIRPWGIGNFPDNSLDSVPLLRLVKLIEKAIDKLQPRIVYTHHVGDLNIDHRRVAEAVLAATRPMAEMSVEEVYAFEVPSSTEWSFGILPPFVPNVFVDISKTLPKKIAAMHDYNAELRPFPHPRSVDGIRTRAQYWGSVSGCMFAEAFQLIRSVRRPHV